jgi:hypothetical protein
MNKRAMVTALGTGVAMAILTGCGGAQNATMPQSSAVAQGRVNRATSSDLLYVSELGGGSKVEILTYPQGQLLATFAPPGDVTFLCSDSEGNVWIPSIGVVYGYTHGSTKPSRALDAPNTQMNACSVDSTGNVAVIGESTSGPVLKVWPHASGTPTTYAVPFYGHFVTYDGSGNIFVGGDGQSEQLLMVELPKNGSAFTTVTIDQPALGCGNLGSDGNYITVGTINRTNPKAKRHVMYRVQVTGSSGHVVQTTAFNNWNPYLEAWTDGSTLLGVRHQYKDAGIGFWKYQEGGNPFKKITGFTDPQGVTVSVGSKN